MLFLAGIILLGAALVVKPYLDSNRSSELVVHVKEAADSACAYLNTGVVIEDSKYSSLNTLITSANYSSIGCVVKGVGIVSEDDQKISLKVSIVYHRSLDQVEVKSAVGAFIKNELKSRRGFSESGGALVYGSKTVEITVEAVRE